jgi:hypothetical protein
MYTCCLCREQFQFRVTLLVLAKDTSKLMLPHIDFPRRKLLTLVFLLFLLLEPRLRHPDELIAEASERRRIVNEVR